VGKRETENEEKNRAIDENQVGYQTARVANANWLREAVFDFLGATADEVGAADATALAGFTSMELDP
jgi:hypothetical protein